MHVYMSSWMCDTNVPQWIVFYAFQQCCVIMIFLCWCYVLRWIWCLWCYSSGVYISTPGKLEKYACPPWPGIFFKLARCGYTLRVTSQMLCKFMFTCMYLLQLSVKRNPPKIPESDRPPSKLCSSPLCFSMQLLYPVLYSFWWYAMPYGEIALNLLIYKLQFGYCTINKLF
jgi:hypothetical protein